MKQEIKDRILAHEKAYKDLCLWLDSIYANEIKMLFGKSLFSYREWLNRDEPELIDGAIVILEIKIGFQSEEMDYILQLLGARRYDVTSYPLNRLHIRFWVPLSNSCKTLMTASGKWTPYWKRYERKNIKTDDNEQEGK
jgi:hypothetical protein